MNYYKVMSAEMCFWTIFNRDLKIVILGDASVGKTSLIQRYLRGIFTDDNISVGILIINYRVQNLKKVKVMI